MWSVGKRATHSRLRNRTRDVVWRLKAGRDCACLSLFLFFGEKLADYNTRLEKQILEKSLDQPEIRMQIVLTCAAKTATAVLAIVLFLLFATNIALAQQEMAAEFSLEPGYELLFNGKDLTGWNYLPTTKQQLKGRARWQKRNPDAPPWPIIEKTISFDSKAMSDDGRFVAENGTLVVTVPPEGRKIQMLYTKQEFSGDFTLKLQFRAAEGADSGVFIKGKQLQCRDYPNAGPTKYKNLQEFKANDWNDLEVVVTGKTAKCTCNGEVLEEKFAVPEKGHIGVEGDQGKIEYRHIRITAGQTSWQQKF